MRKVFLVLIMVQIILNVSHAAIPFTDIRAILEAKESLLTELKEKVKTEEKVEVKHEEKVDCPNTGSNIP
ncbi:hypothetical protein QE197_25720 (plasmid) [Arsenophonus nasoniae]|nr:hypothetical protein [Arsenophonus nasoniae]QBY46900.1 hypothetical protein ArsFIN_55110 [Arsenophonus nasoniae]WGM13870.1 hypothetical protein QE197_25720 [Arsenophonus nasoniae]WGM18508.1 hypothetical protein QE193_25325 [Arsenophonus nasoniae]